MKWYKATVNTVINHTGDCIPQAVCGALDPFHVITISLTPLQKNINLPGDVIEMNCTWSTAVGGLDSDIDKFLLVH